MIAGLAFTAPWLLLGLLALPVLWLLLRAIPPAPIRRRFPGVALLLGLEDKDRQADRTPWWLLLLRALAVAAAILGFAGPILNPEPGRPGTGPLVILLDGGWADARDWARRQERAMAALEEAGRAGRPVAVAALADTPQALLPGTAADWQGRLGALQPRPWLPQDLTAWAANLPEGDFETLWLAEVVPGPGLGP